MYAYNPYEKARMKKMRTSVSNSFQYYNFQELPQPRSKATEKRRNGRFVEYLIAGTWKKNKDMTDDEKLACKVLRDEEKSATEGLKSLAGLYTETAMRGDTAALDRIESRSTFADIQDYLAEYLNTAGVRTDEDIGDWGNVKNSVHIYEDTFLIAAIRSSNLASVSALLRSGLCDPTLQTCCSYIDDRYTMHESDIVDAKIAARRAKTDIISNYEKKAREVKIYGSDYRTRTLKEVKTGAAREAAKIVRRIEEATKIEVLVEEALSMWPEAHYKSPLAGYGDPRKKASYSNRMRGVSNIDSQRKATQRLREKLSSAMENCPILTVSESAIASIIEQANPPIDAIETKAEIKSSNGHKLSIGKRQRALFECW